MPAEKPLISVIIPFYNRVAMTCQALESVLAQTWQHFEIILVDDGSTESLAVLRTYQDPRIRILSQPNQGPASARNNGIRNARGEWIAFLDSDDLFLPEKLERQVGVHQQKPNLLISHTSYFLVREDKRIEEVNVSGFAGEVMPGLLIHCPIAMPTVMVKRDALHGERLFPEDYQVAEDIIFYARILADSELVALREPLSEVRVFESSKNSLPTAQITGARNILHFLHRSSVLSSRDLRIVRSRLYENIALNFLILRQYWQYLPPAIRSFFIAPLSTKIIKRSWMVLQPFQFIARKLK